MEELSVDPSNILVVTFTKDAAISVQSRYQQEATGGILPVFGTFHSVFYMILRQEMGIRPSGILSGKLAIDLLSRITKINGISSRGEEFLPGLLRAISFYRNRSTTRDYPLPEGISGEQFLFVLQEYEKAKEKAALIDFDDMIFKTRDLLQRDEKILQKWREKFQYILVDEAQDMNQMQYQLIRLLAYPRDNLFLVGDDDQSIYGFRGASPDFLLNFPKDFPDAKVVLLGANYRCAKAIVKASEGLIAHNRQRFEKSIVAAGKQEGLVRLLTGENGAEEAAYCTQLIQRLLAEGVKKQEIAVLYRNNAQGKLLHERLGMLGLVDEKADYLQSFVCKDLLAYLRASFGKVSRGDFLRILSHPNRGFNRFGLEKAVIDPGEWLCVQQEGLFGQKAEELREHLRTLSLLSPWAAIQFVRKGMGYDGYLMGEAEKNGLSKHAYIKMADRLLDLSRDYRNIPAFLQEVDRLQRVREDMKNAPSKEKTQSISFHTFHGCKGLEYDTVIILGACEGIMPSRKATDLALLEEERRMFYVAMTRAKRQLFISVIGHQSNEVLYPSRFIKEAFAQGIQSLVIPSS